MPTSSSTDAPYQLRHRRSPTAVAIVVLLVGAGAPMGPVVGQPSETDESAPSGEESSEDESDDMQRFERHVASGTEYFKTDQYRKALTHFRKARDLVDHPNLSFRIGRALEELRKCDAAEVAYKRYLSYDDIDADARERGKERLEQIEQCEPIGTLEVTCEPEGAAIEVGDESASCPASVELSSGTYELVATAEGRSRQTAQVEIEAGERTETVVKLPPQREQSEGATADDSPSSDSGTSPTTDSGGPSVGAGPDRSAIVGWSAVGTGAALLASGTISDATAAGRVDDLRRARESGEASRVRALVGSRGTARARTIALYATGSALLAGGITLLVLPLDRTVDDSGAATAEFRVRPNGAALDVTW